MICSDCFSATRRVSLLAVAAMIGSGCGVIGAPVAPEDVGLTPIIERQKTREAEEAGRAVQPPPALPANIPGLTASEGDMSQQTDDLPVPPLQSVGTKP